MAKQEKVKRVPKSWNENECMFLQECVIIGIPLKVMAKYFPDRTSTSISQKINSEGLHEIKQLHKDYMLAKFTERYLNDGVPTDASGRIIWTKPVVSFVRKAFLMNVPMHDIAEILGIHWRTVNNKVRYFNSHRNKFRVRYARMMHYLFVDNPKRRW